MKRQIRSGIFETNSSSTHVLTIQKANVLDDHSKACVTFSEAIEGNEPVTIEVLPNNYGWEHRVYSDISNKLMYLLIAIDSTYQDVEERIKQIEAWLKEVNIEIKCPAYRKGEKSWTDNENNVHTYLEHGFFEEFDEYGLYIDHTEDLGDFVRYVMEDKNHFYNFIFGIRSSIETGNDNEGTFPWWYNKQYKGFDEMFKEYEPWWVKDGDDRDKVYEEMHEQYPDEEFYTVPDDVVEFYKGN